MRACVCVCGGGGVSVCGGGCVVTDLPLENVRKLQ